jgi:hypothetical protein
LYAQVYIFEAVADFVNLHAQTLTMLVCAPYITCYWCALQVQVDADDVDYVNELDDDDVTGDNDDDEDSNDIEQSELQVRSTILRKMYEAEALNINEVSKCSTHYCCKNLH